MTNCKHCKSHLNDETTDAYFYGIKNYDLKGLAQEYNRIEINVLLDMDLEDPYFIATADVFGLFLESKPTKILYCPWC